MSRKGMQKRKPSSPRSSWQQFAPLYFLLITAIAQTSGAFFSVGLRANICATGCTFWEGAWIVGLWGFIAWLVSLLFRLSSPWRLLNFAVGPASIAYLVLGLPAWPLLIPIAIGMLIYLPTFWTRVPYYPTSLGMYQAIAKELPTDREFTFMDLGCGFGALLEFLSARFPKGKFTGVEIGLLPYLLARFRLRDRPNVKIRFQNFWHFSLSPYEIVYAFLAPGPMPQLWEKVRSELLRDSLFLVNSFPAPEKPKRVVEVDDERKCKLFVYQISGD